MSQEPEPLDFPDADPVTVDDARAMVDGWRPTVSPGLPITGLHQIAIALAAEVERLTKAHADQRVMVQQQRAQMKAAHARHQTEVAEGQRTFDLRYGWMLERERALCEAALGCSEGMACRRPVWFGCCATRKRICEALGVEFHVERTGSLDSSVIDDVPPRGATVSGEGG